MDPESFLNLPGQFKAVRNHQKHALPLSVWTQSVSLAFVPTLPVCLDPVHLSWTVWTLGYLSEPCLDPVYVCF